MGRAEVSHLKHELKKLSKEVKDANQRAAKSAHAVQAQNSVAKTAVFKRALAEQKRKKAAAASAKALNASANTVAMVKKKLIQEVKVEKKLRTQNASLKAALKGEKAARSGEKGKAVKLVKSLRGQLSRARNQLRVALGAFKAIQRQAGTVTETLLAE